jgi:hypothetical protein
MHRIDNLIDTHNQAEPVATLLIRVRDLHRAAEQAGCNALHHALDAGDALIQVQKQVTGPWKEWLAANCSVPTRTALLYVQLAKHREKIEMHLGELSIRGALRLITKPKQKTARKLRHDEASLQSLWARAPEQEKAAFCDAVGIAGFRKIWSLNFHRALLDSVRMEKAEADPAVNMNRMLWSALLLLTSIDEPKSTEIMRLANTRQLLSVLRILNKTIRAVDNSKEDALSIVKAGTIPASPEERERDNRKKRAA